MGLQVESRWSPLQPVGECHLQVALPKRKSNMWPRVDSSAMHDRSETGIWKGGKQVVQEGESAENIEMKPPPTSGRKITVKTKDSKADVKEAEGE
jgi:hypothetical protein